MDFCEQAYERVESIWKQQLEHPFVQGIGDGTLELDRFKRWVRQDYRYLKEFSRVFAWGAAKARRLEDMQFFAGALDLTLNVEMGLHREYAARFEIGSDELESTAMWPTTRAYTDFLVRVSADGDLADLVAALLPCAWGYAWLGEALSKGQGQPGDARYRDWIATYAGEEFQGAAEGLKSMMNRLAEHRSQEKVNYLLDLFEVSSRYEAQFWDMCWEGEEWPYSASGAGN